MSTHAQPIILVEDDPDDQLLIAEITQSLNPNSEILIFDTGDAALEFLLATTQQPFIIICDVNMPRMNGLQLRREIVSNERLLKKAIPFVFFSTTAVEKQVDLAFDMVVQGYFEKGNTYEELKEELKMIYDYWRHCKHPNTFK
ncbi:MAG: response regulator [Chryseolinea sp.]